MMLRKIISGGQTGADQGALMAAVELGLETGGWIPQGWRTEKGREEWLSRMGLIQTPEFTYPKRTEHNVKAADATFLFGNAKSPGCKLTLNLCRDYGKPYLVVPWSVGKPQPSDVGFLHWLDNDLNWKILNVAGNRESRQPGIRGVVKAFLVDAIKKHCSTWSAFDGIR